MIEEAQVEPLIHALDSDDDPGHQRLLLEAFTHLGLSPAAWRAASWVARSALRTLGDPNHADPAVMHLAARVPLRSIRDRLRHLASDPEFAAALPAALALAEVGDPSGAETLVRDLAREPSVAVALALARLPLEEGLVQGEDLEPALRPDEDGGQGVIRMWGSIALARIGESDPLEELWDGLVRLPEALARQVSASLFPTPPGLFSGAPGTVTSQLAAVRPLPAAVLGFIHHLRRRDYDDEWSPRRSDLVAHPRDARLLFEGLTGQTEGPPEEAEPLVEGGPAEPPPLSAAGIVEAAALKGLARRQVAWIAARSGPDRILESLAPLILSGVGEERIRWLSWLAEMARQWEVPPPLPGDAGEGDLRPSPGELVDDIPKEMMATSPRPPAGPRPSDPPGAIIELFPDIATDTPHPLMGTPLVLTVSLDLEAADSTRGTVTVPDTTCPVVLRAHLLLGSASAWSELTWVTGEGTVRPAVFTLTAPDIQTNRALMEVRVNFYLEHRWCGEASRHLDVRQDSGVPPLDEIPLPPGPPSWRAGLTLEPGAVPPDLIVRIQRGEAAGRYLWSCLSPHLDLPAPDDPAKALMTLAGDAATFVRQQFGPRANRPLGRMDLADIEGIGEEIYRATPDHFKDSYWAVQQWSEEAGLPFESIQIVTDEPFIPWELMRLDDPVRAPGIPAEFLALRQGVGRWLAEHVGGPRQRIPVSELAVAASDYLDIPGTNPLPWAAKELHLLETTHRATPVALLGETVLDFLEHGTAQVVHFACHGRMSLQNPNASELVMEDAKHVRPTHVARGQVRDQGLGRHHPLVFLNACEVGGAAEALSLVAGFPAAFLKAGASALVSPLWVVNDERAFEIARDFYQAALVPGGGRPLGQLLRDVRARWRDEGHLTYLAYVLYGDPLAWVDPVSRSDPPAPPYPSLPSPRASAEP
ncbi:MAG: CHAT domain-containing protein [Gemmatimonadales bacterium]|nr:MAG: CHAT domain-containing protein [Gemmatimonadales bacterium]